MSGLTPWFTDGQEPARPGIYNISCRKSAQSGDWYARWDGHQWFIASESISAAARANSMASPGHLWHSEGSWRGLSSEPKS